MQEVCKSVSWNCPSYCECRQPITWGLDWKEVLIKEKREGMGEWDVGIGLTGKPSMTCLLMLHKKNDNNVMQTAGMKHAEGSISIHVGM